MKGHPEEQDIERFVDQELKGSKSDEIKKHLDECAECRKKADELVRLRSFVVNAVKEEAESVNLTRIWSNVQAEIGRETFLERLVQSFYRPKRAFAYVAAAVILIVALIGLRYLSGIPSPTVVESVTYGDDPGITVIIDKLASTDTTVVWINGLEIEEEN